MHRLLWHQYEAFATSENPPRLRALKKRGLVGTYSILLVNISQRPYVTLLLCCDTTGMLLCVYEYDPMTGGVCCGLYGRSS
eukprot:3941705-Rhodomonas_salina.7